MYDPGGGYDLIELLPDQISRDTMKVALQRLWRLNKLPQVIQGRTLIGIKVPITWSIDPLRTELKGEPFPEVAPLFYVEIEHSRTVGSARTKGVIPPLSKQSREPVKQA